MYFLCACLVNAFRNSIWIKVSVYRKPLLTTTALPIQPPKLKNQRTQNFQDAVLIAFVR